MPFTELAKGRKRVVTLELKGPRTAAEQKRLKAALKKVLSTSPRGTPSRRSGWDRSGASRTGCTW
jgi:hypothetical protein